MSITTLNFLSFLNPYLFQQAHQHVCWQRSLMRLIEYDATVPVIEEKDKFIRGTFWCKDKSDDIVKLAEWCSAVTIKIYLETGARNDQIGGKCRGTEFEFPLCLGA